MGYPGEREDREAEMTCTHTDLPSCLPAHWNNHCCRECWDKDVQPLFDALPKEPFKGKDFESVGPLVSRGDGTTYREQQWK